MKKITCAMLLLVMATTFSFAQNEEKMKNEGVVKGTIYKNGGEIEGYIKIMGSTYWKEKWYDAPWQFQDVIKFIPKDVFEKNEKIKGKFYEKYEAKDCDGYKYDTLIYESVKYADMSAVGMNMLAKKMFLKKVCDNKISIFEHYSKIPEVGVYQEGEYEKLIADCQQVNMVYRIGKNGKLKLVNSLNIAKELSDCPRVVEKNENGEYKAIEAKDGGKGSGFNRLMNNTIFRDQVKLLAIEDYNNNCK